MVNKCRIASIWGKDVQKTFLLAMCEQEDLQVETQYRTRQHNNERKTEKNPEKWKRRSSRAL